MKRGFTLIEILIVVSVIVVILLSMSGIISQVFNTQNKNNATDKIDQNGSWILNELKKNVLNADGNSENGLKFSCSMNKNAPGNSIVITSVKDGDETTIACLGDATNGYKIASISGVGTTIYLFQRNNDLQLIDCASFVSCSTLPSFQLSDVNFNFILQAGTSTLSSGTSKVFSADVTLRN